MANVLWWVFAGIQSVLTLWCVAGAYAIAHGIRFPGPTMGSTRRASVYALTSFAFAILGAARATSQDTLGDWMHYLGLIGVFTGLVLGVTDRRPSGTRAPHEETR